jgi:hypothetical protein
MTEPDEALIWARLACGDNTREQRRLADAYRAGQAASAERIKALEEVTQNLIAMFDCDDPEVSARAWDEALDEARALLKEADQ